jgi:hypothetical protein
MNIQLLQALPQLQELSATYFIPEVTQDALPSGLGACGLLRRCQLINGRSLSNAVDLTDSISG